jgi:hypothetical protein
VFCCYRCADFVDGVFPNCAASAADRFANFAMSSRRRNFCFLNRLNLALSPFCDDICPRCSNLFVAQRAEDESVRCSIHQATDRRCEAQGTLKGNPVAAAAGQVAPLAPCLPTECPAACPQHTPFFEAESETWPNAAAVARFPRNRAVSTGRCTTL